MQTRFAVYGLCMLLTASCGSTAKEVRTATVPAGYRGGASVFAKAKALDFVPKQARWVIVASSLTVLTKRLPIRELVKARLGKLSSLLDPVALSQAGVAINKTVGVAHVGERSDTIALFFNVTNEAELVKFVTKQVNDAKDLIRDEKSGQARLLMPEKHKRIGVVLRGGIAMIVVAPAMSARDRVAVRLANISKAEALSALPAFRRTAAALGFGEHVGVYLALSAMFGTDDSGMVRLVDREKRLRAKLLKARTKPLKALLIRRELRMLAASKREYVRDRKRMLLLAGLGTIAVGARIDAMSIRTKLAIVPAPGSPFVNLLAPQPATIQLLRAMTAFPLLAVAGHMRVKPLLALVGQLTGAQGIPFERIKMIFGQLTKQNFDSDFVPMLSGEIGFAVTEGAKGRSGVDMLLGVRSPEKARALFNRLAADKRMAAFRVKSSGSPRFRLPSGGQFVYLGLAGSAIIVTTDGGLFARLQRHGRSRLAKVAGHPRLKTLLKTSVATMLVMVSGKLLGQLLAPTRHRRIRLRRWRDKFPAIPRSKQYLRALVELLKLDKTIVKAEQALERHEQQYYRRLGARFGEAVLVVLPDADRLIAYGGLFTTNRLSDAIAAARIPARRDAAHRAKLGRRAELLVQRDKLWRKITAIRHRDIGRSLGTNKSKTPKK